MDSERRQARREARRRELARRRRRTFAGLSLLLAAVVVAAVALLAGRGGSKPSTRGVAGSGNAPRGSSSAQSGGSTSPQGSSSSAGAATGKPRTGAAPILMYHVINPPPPGAPFPGLYVSASEFAAQMQALAKAGFHAVTLDQLQAYWRHGAPLPPGKPIVVSFDNGYQSQYTNALPVLRRLGWVGDESIQLTGLPPSQGGLSEAQVRGLVAAGWELDTQGFSHADLIALDGTQLAYQVAGARKVIQQRYGVPVNWFCYPSGHYDATVIAEVKTAGYAGSTTVVPGWAGPNSDPYRLPRLRVLGGTGPEALLSEIAAIRNDPAPPASYSG
ncbi:MAG TPA: polysaccharide deacetylase family protein [Solirubrobacteraceae bacterium]|nr:polysaccharide deacetylase family protein [Solirubrobacteraceae bacterium]